MQFFIKNEQVVNAIREMMATLGITSYTEFIYVAIKALKDSDPVARRLPFTPKPVHAKKPFSTRATLNSAITSLYTIEQIEAIMMAIGIDSTTLFLYAAIEALKEADPRLAAIPFETRKQGRPVMIRHGLIPIITDGKYECPQCHKKLTRQGWHQHGCRGESA